MIGKLPLWKAEEERKGGAKMRKKIAIQGLVLVLRRGKIGGWEKRATGRAVRVGVQ